MCRKADHEGIRHKGHYLSYLSSPVRKIQLITASVFHTYHPSLLPYSHANHDQFGDVVEKVMHVEVKIKLTKLRTMMWIYLDQSCQTNNKGKLL